MQLYQNLVSFAKSEKLWENTIGNTMYTQKKQDLSRVTLHFRNNREDIWAWPNKVESEGIQKKEEAKKWGLSLTSTIFPKDGDLKETQRLLQIEIDKLTNEKKIDVTKNPYKIIIDEIRLFTRDIFDKNGAYKPDSLIRIGNLRRALWEEGINAPDAIEKKRKEALLFREKNPVESYKQKLIQYCIDHPKLAENSDFLKNEKAKIDWLWATELWEYNIIVATLLGIVENKEFDKNTGVFSRIALTMKGRWDQAKEFEDKLRLLIDMSVQQKLPLDLSYFDIKKTLSEGEKRWVDVYMKDIDARLGKIESVEARLKFLGEATERNKKNESGNSDAFVAEVVTRLSIRSGELKKIQSAPSFATDIAKKIIWRDDTAENSDAAEKIAKQKTVESGMPHFAYFEGKEWKWQYRIVTIKEISSTLSRDVRDINVGLFTTITWSPGWESLFYRFMWPDAIAAVGAYITNFPNTRLFAWENGKAKQFFLDQYKKEFIEQNKVLSEKKIWELSNEDFVRYFPALSSDPKISETMRNTLRKWDVVSFYNELAKSSTNGEILKYMLIIKDGASKIQVQIKKEILDSSEKDFQWKRVWDYLKWVTPRNPSDKERLKKLENIAFNGTLKIEEIEFLLTYVTDKKLIEYLSKFTKGKTAANIEWKAIVWGQIVGSRNKNEKARVLTPNQTPKMDQGGDVKSAVFEQDLGKSLGRQNLETKKYQDILDDPMRIQKEIDRLKGLPWDQTDAIAYLESQLYRNIRVATSVSDYSVWLPKKDIVWFVREALWSQQSDTQIMRWVETQQFINTYVAEKNFVQLVEQRAAFMNMNESRSIRSLYDESGKVQIASMTSEVGSVSLADTNIQGINGFRWMSELLQCQIRTGSESFLTRTITDKNGNVIAENVPLSSLDTTISQLGRLYAIGLGVLAPKMREINQAISSVRPDAIGGLDGTYSLTEDKKFLEVMITSLYGESALPEEKSIPNLIRVFQSTQADKAPLLRLKSLGILDESRQIRIETLRGRLQTVSKSLP